MELVAAPTMEPAVCRTCRSASGPQVDTRRMDQFGRVYICAECIGTFVQLLPEPPEPPADKLAELQAEIERLAKVEAAYLELRTAVGFTLMHGVTIRRGKVSLRNKPGLPAVDL